MSLNGKRARQPKSCMGLAWTLIRIPAAPLDEPIAKNSASTPPNAETIVGRSKRHRHRILSKAKSCTFKVWVHWTLPRSCSTPYPTTRYPAARHRPKHDTGPNHPSGPLRIAPTYLRLKMSRPTVTEKMKREARTEMRVKMSHSTATKKL